MAGDEVTGAVLLESGHGAAAHVPDIAATGVKATARGWVGRAGPLPLEEHRPHHLPGIRRRYCRHQRFGVRVPGGVVEALRGRGLHQLAKVHDRHSVAGMRDGREIVRDEQVRNAELLLQGLQQVQNLRLNRDVEGGDRLVANYEIGAQHQGPGDGDALALAAAECMRKPAQVLEREPAAPGDIEHPLFELRPFGQTVGDERFGDDVTHRHPRVERGIGVLEDDLHVPPHGPQPAAVEVHDIDGLAVAVEAHLSAGRLDGAQHGAAQGRLAGAALADESEGFAPQYPEADTVHRAHHR